MFNLKPNFACAQVPFGQKAFMPGQLVHTNEILVLLGDNWFVDRSAKQAGEIVQRRVKGSRHDVILVLKIPISSIGQLHQNFWTPEIRHQNIY